MESERGISLPAMGFAIVIFFASTVFLAPRGFDSLRPAEVQSAKPLELEAHLWEDPLAALRRHVEKLGKQCEVLAADRSCPDSAFVDVDHVRSRYKDTKDLTLIAALVPGSLLGGEEARRRTRFAVLSGLSVAGFAPENSETLSAFRAARCDSLSGCAGEGRKSLSFFKAPKVLFVDIPFETFVDKNKRTAVVFWINERSLGPQWLIVLANIFRFVAPENPTVQLRILGPSSSEAIVTALQTLKALKHALTLEPLDRTRLATFEEGWRVLAKLRLISPNSSTPERQLLKAAGISDQQEGCVAWGPVSVLNTAFSALLKDVRDKLGFTLFSDQPLRDKLGLTLPSHLPFPQQPVFYRTIATDDRLSDTLFDGLFNAESTPRFRERKQKVALITEWDSLYARTFVDTLKDRSKCASREMVDIEFVQYPYLRGLDGVLPKDTLSPPAPARAAPGDALASVFGQSRSKPEGTPVEWPEGADQRDYMRALVEDLQVEVAKWRTSGGGLAGIGIVGDDVHDKLLLMQALRQAFPDDILFTTDVDSRLVHPAVTRYTRNLIVASSLPLTLEDTLRCGVPPFRDGLQTATFLAARYAVVAPGEVDEGRGRDCTRVAASDLEGRINDLVAKPRLLAVGRDGYVELAYAGREKSFGAPTTADKSQTTTSAQAHGDERVEARLRGEKERKVYAWCFATVFAFVFVLMTKYLPGPAMALARRRLLYGPNLDAHGAKIRVDTAVLGALQMASLGFACGVLLELVWPTGHGRYLAGGLALAATGSFVALAYPGFARALLPKASWTRLLVAVAVLAVLVGIDLMCKWALPSAATPDLEALAVNNAWPSQLLLTLGIVLFTWFLDYSWCKSVDDMKWITKTYFPGEDDAQHLASVGNGGQSQLGIGHHESEGLPEGAHLWIKYRSAFKSGPRLLRILIFLFFAYFIIWLIELALGGQQSGAPERGFANLLLIPHTFRINQFTVLVLLVIVGDIIVQTWRFINQLKRARTVYPTATVKKFAMELGPELRIVGGQRISAKPQQRFRTDGRNSFLDDWIDMRLVSDHTAAIGMLSILPYVLLGFMIVSRSRMFDDWRIGTAEVVLFSCLAGASVGMTLLLSAAAETARRLSLDSMHTDLLWLRGAGNEYRPLAEQFSRLIEEVKQLRRGAFAPFLRQPSIQALLVPLGGAGTIQLLDYLFNR